MRFLSIKPAPEVWGPAVDSRTLGARVKATAKFLFATEAHVFAFAIAANVLLAFVPFMVLLISICKNIFHSEAALRAIDAMMQVLLPSDQAFIIRNVTWVAGKHNAQILSVVMLIFTCSGVMLPLEVALNRIWGFSRNRSYLRNQITSYGIAVGCAALALLATVAIGANLNALAGVLAHVDSAAVVKWSRVLTIKVVSLPTSFLIFFVIYYFMPNGRVPVRPVAFSAVFAAIFTEIAGAVFVRLLPWLDFAEVYRPFHVSVTLVLYSFVTSLALLAGAHFVAQDARPAAAPPAAVPPRTA